VSHYTYIARLVEIQDRCTWFPPFCQLFVNFLLHILSFRNIFSGGSPDNIAYFCFVFFHLILRLVSLKDTSPGREASGNWNAKKLNMFASILRRFLRFHEVPCDAGGWREEGSCYSSPYISF
jgi:hypothetical protein